MSKEHPPLVRTRLSLLMFLTFFLWGSWGVAITGLADSLGFQGWQIGLLGAVPAIGAMISPLFVGLIADRYFPAQRVLGVLHLMGAACLILAGYQKEFPGLMTLMMLNGLFFMPTIALANSVAFTHIPDPDKFPRIAVLGTIGWIAAVLFASVFLGGASKPFFLFQAGTAGIVLALYCFTLPHTPPKGADARGDVFGLSAMKLLKESSFLIFIVCVFFVSIPACGYFFTLQVPMLMQRGYPSPLALTSLNQFAEIVFMFSMPWFVAKIGLKRVVAIGMLAWAVRYLCFACPDFSAALVGLILHGFCYSFFYVGAYMYVDKRAPAELKSSAQSLVTFLLLGVGFFLGSMGAGQMMERFPAQVTRVSQNTSIKIVDLSDAEETDGNRVVVTLVRGEQPAEEVVNLENGDVTVREVVKPMPAWNDPAAATSAWRYLNLSGTVKQFLPKTPAAVVEQIVRELDENGDGEIVWDELEQVPDDGVTISIADPADASKVTDEKFTRGALAEIFGVQPPDLPTELDTDGDGTITMAEVQAIPDEGVKLGDFVTYTRDELTAVFKKVARLRADSEEVAAADIRLTRKDWLAVQSCDWWPIWLWPSITVFIVLVIFVVAFRDQPAEKEGKESAGKGGGAPADAGGETESPGGDEGSGAGE